MRLCEEIARAIDDFVICGGDIDMEVLVNLIKPHTAQLEADNERLREYIELYHDEDFVMWCREQDALKEGE